MLFHVTENLLKKVGFENKKVFVANARGPAGGGGGSGALGYASHLVLSCTPVEKSHWGMHPTLCCLAPL